MDPVKTAARGSALASRTAATPGGATTYPTGSDPEAIGIGDLRVPSAGHDFGVRVYEIRQPEPTEVRYADMAHLVRKEVWGIVDLDLDQGAIRVREDWRYDWRVAAGQSPWSHDETIAYHRAVDRLVWATWSFKARLFPKCVGTMPRSAAATELGNRFGGHGLQLTFDIRNSGAPTAHWSVTVTKVDRNLHPMPRSHVWFEQRRLELHSIDIVPLHASRSNNDPVHRPNFFVAPHEFGHTLGYGDDYLSSRYFRDAGSIMNIGRLVRPRHLALVAEAVHQMVPGCKFVAVMP